MNWDKTAAAGPPPGYGFGPEANGEPNVEFHFDGTGLSDFFEELFGRRSRYGTSFRSGGAQTGAREATAHGYDIEGDILVTLEEVMHGAIRPISLQRVDPRTGETTSQSFKVRIPPGVQDGRTIRVPGHGGEGIGGGHPGDVFFVGQFSVDPPVFVYGGGPYSHLGFQAWGARHWSPASRTSIA